MFNMEMSHIKSNVDLDSVANGLSQYADSLRNTGISSIEEKANYLIFQSIVWKTIDRDFSHLREILEQLVCSQE